ncbi:class I SAM-dependent methyltransferase [Spirilliplanes yamanashiensis]|uniref:Methyltransferase type 12 n=1 Tax=Spirilliplanes yamanashiensis TaxID=42233 RepID=A0A8J3Y7J4_9ACTN|nr:class I SAM-dependent methyltransferase [Spirilliplanes yamanashiensis]MDP9817375.1 SAM-dependent methyltransferase [Spirilliplanes yamanashiensis]GIJ02974.1 methyltransferase type 12 [Spirilliplanes yamanashiensis]
MSGALLDRPVLAVYEAALRRAAAGRPAPLVLRDDRGGEHLLDPAAWCRAALPGDRLLLTGCGGPTLDVGCGPGRLTAALTRRGRPALGVDVSAAAVRLARRRGAAALLRDVFAPLPGHGRWRHVLLADGNIGIGGDPARLLRRCRDLLAPDGRLHAELAAPGERTWSGTAGLRAAGTDREETFPWAAVAVPDLPALAAAAGLRVLTIGTEADRWFATLTPA